MRNQRQVKKRPDGALEVTFTKTFQTAEEVRFMRDRIRSDVEATRNLLQQLEGELADAEAAYESLTNGQG